MITQTQEQIQAKIDFINHYKNSKNAADGSKLDANANVSSKNIATMEAELHKGDNIQINRYLVRQRIEKMFGKELADEYLRQINAHEIYVHDETSLKPYCVSINMFPFLRDGIVGLGGESKAPKNLDSFCGSFINLVFAVASQFAGAVATVEFLMYMEKFIRQEFGEHWHIALDQPRVCQMMNGSYELPTIREEIEQRFQQVVYSINQPAAARGYQSVFWNISLFDENYFNSMFGDFMFPDGDFPEWKSLDALQRLFMKWFNKERERAVLTFPVVTAAVLTKDGEPSDEEFAQMLSQELSEGNSFFVYMSDSADSLASCCRLRNEIDEDSRDFSFSLGAGGVATGSVNVITLNVNRFIQNHGRDFKAALEQQVDKMHKYHIAYRSLVQEDIDAGMLPVYDAGYISLDKQFNTIGINGFVEAAEYLGYEISHLDEDYTEFGKDFLGTIYAMNRKATAETGIKFNTEFVPAENLGVKNAKWDRADGLYVPRDCMNSYFFKVECPNTTPLDKFELHGRAFVDYLDGGSALHLNLDEHLTKDAYRRLFSVAAQTGCNYWTINVRNTVCNVCGHIDKKTLESCPKCGSTDIDYATRIIGYLKKVSNFSSERQQEHNRRYYA